MNTFLLIFALATQIMPSARHAVATLPASGGAGVTYLFVEDFNDPGFDGANANGWTLSNTGGGTVTDDDTSVYASGALRLDVGGTGDYVFADVGSALSTMYVYCEVTYVVSTATQNIIGFDLSLTASMSGEAVLNFISSNTHLLLGTGDPTSISDGQAAYMWIKMVSGTGADGVLDMYVATSSTRPGTATSASTTTTQNENLRYLTLGVDADTNIHVNRIVVHNVAEGIFSGM